MIRPLVAAVTLVLSSAVFAQTAPPDAPRPAAPAQSKAAAGGGQQLEAIDGVAAVVNGEIITFSQMRQVAGPRERLLRSQYRGEELMAKIKEVRTAALKDLIDRQLVIQAFKKEGFQVPDHYLDSRIKEIINEHFNGDRQAFIRTLSADNYTEGEFKKNELDKLIVQAMRSKNVKTPTVVSPTRVEEYYREHRAEFTTKEEIKLRMIMISGKGAASQKSFAEEVLGKIVKGGEFDQIARVYSEDSTRDNGGDWGWIERKTLAAPLEKIAFSLPTNKVSNIVEFGGNYYILKVEERRGGVTKPLAQAREDIEKKLLSLDAQQMQEKWIAGLRQKAYIQTY